jgi:hypothetical protein
MMFITSQLLLIGDGLLPASCWQSFHRERNAFGTRMRWTALGLNVLVMLIASLFGYNLYWCLGLIAAFYIFVLVISRATGATTPSAPTATGSGDSKSSPAPVGA